MAPPDRLIDGKVTALLNVSAARFPLILQVSKGGKLGLQPLPGRHGRRTRRHSGRASGGGCEREAGSAENVRLQRNVIGCSTTVQSRGPPMVRVGALRQPAKDARLSATAQGCVLDEAQFRQR